MLIAEHFQISIAELFHLFVNLTFSQRNHLYYCIHSAIWKLCWWFKLFQLKTNLFLFFFFKVALVQTYNHPYSLNFLSRDLREKITGSSSTNPEDDILASGNSYHNVMTYFLSMLKFAWRKRCPLKSRYGRLVREDYLTSANCFWIHGVS